MPYNNDSKHTNKSTTQWLKNRINGLQLPSQSPELTPIVGGTLRELHKVRRKTDYIMLMLLDMVLQATES